MVLDFELELLSVANFRSLSVDKKFEVITNGAQLAIDIQKEIISLENKLFKTNCLNERKDCMENRKVRRNQFQIAVERLTQFLIIFFNLENTSYKFSISVKSEAISLYTNRNQKEKDRLRHGHYGINFTGPYIFARHYTHRSRSPEPMRHYKVEKFFKENPLKSASI